MPEVRPKFTSSGPVWARGIRGRVLLHAAAHLRKQDQSPDLRTSDGFGDLFQ